MSAVIVLILVFPLFYLFTGYLLRKHHSRFPDTFCGYHVGQLAYKNENTWKAANTYSGNVLIRISLVTFCISAVFSIVCYLTPAVSIWDAVLFIYLMCAALIPIIVLIVLTERHLKELFDEYGNYKKLQ